MRGRWFRSAITGFIASILGVFTNLFTGVLKLIILASLILFFCEGVPMLSTLTMIVIFLIAFLWIFIGSFARLGYLEYNLAILDRRKSYGGMLFDASALWWNSFELHLRMMIMIAIGSIFFLIPGIVVYYNYAMAPFLLECDHKLSVSAAMRLSKKKMKGKRWKFFCFRLSFIGWKLLGFLSLGLAFFWVNPYYSMSETVFFNEASGRAEKLYGREL
ncbi:MAG: DUF975 family protein [Eubacteriales bacterium]|nr:DUF975 family protein [Eubacteriales bacterium]